VLRCDRGNQRSCEMTTAQAREGHQGILEGAQSFDIQVIGRFRRANKTLPPAFNTFARVHAIAFAAR